MRRLAGIVAVGSVAACGLLGAPSASAVLSWPQHVGDPCAATGTLIGESAIDIAGQPTTREMTVRLPGWAKRPPGGRHSRPGRS
jgi:hypothetical protein